MFTGIIQETGVVAEAARTKLAIRANARFVRKLAKGSSVAVDGTCLTVVAKKNNSFTADLMPESARRTTLGSLRKGVSVNLELPATPQTFLSGHIVQGHVDGVGKIKSIRKDGSGLVFSISVSRPIARHIVTKGSVAISGISLTVIGIRGAVFTVGIIPHTYATTMLHALKAGDPVNVEVDVLAKYVEKLVRNSKYGH